MGFEDVQSHYHFQWGVNTHQWAIVTRSEGWLAWKGFTTQSLPHSACLGPGNPIQAMKKWRCVVLIVMEGHQLNKRRSSMGLFFTAQGAELAFLGRGLCGETASGLNHTGGGSSSCECLHASNRHTQPRKTLPSLWASSGGSFTTPMSTRHIPVGFPQLPQVLLAIPSPLEFSDIANIKCTLLKYLQNLF